MNEQTKRAAITAKIVAVEHLISTSYSDDRAPFTFARTHNVATAGMCGMCRSVESAMTARVVVQNGEKESEQ